MRNVRSGLLLLVLALLVGCAGGAPLPTATAVGTAAVPTMAAPTMAPTVAARTAAGQPAPATPAPAATRTPEATATRTAAPAASATPTPATGGANATPASPTPGGVPTVIRPPQAAIQLPPGFGISVFAQGFSAPRAMTVGPDGQVYLVERGAGRVVRLPDRNRDGVADAVEPVATGLNSPSSLAFYKDGSLYVGETAQVERFSEPNAQGVFQKREVIVPGLPASAGHFTRTVLFSPDWNTLYVSVGSSCNVCIESDPRRAAIMRYNPDGSGGQVFAKGLRNAVGLAIRPGTSELWATNNGRDNMGDDLPPETVNLVRANDDFGWPRCHSGDLVDPQFGKAGACDGVAQPVIKMQAHSAPLGLTFYTGAQFPPEYRGGVFVAFHGSWNRTVPTGYKVVWAPIQNGRPGPVQDLASGWLRSNGSNWGRPSDVLTAPDGSLLICDDTGGVIYRVFYSGK